MFKSVGGSRENRAIGYLLAVLAGAGNLSASFAFRSASAFVFPSVSLSLAILSGIIFTALGLYATVKDADKSFGVFCLVVGSVIVGTAQLATTSM